MNSSKRLTKILSKEVVNIPVELKPGFLYISKKYETAVHLCCCNCGFRVVTPLYNGAWSVSETDTGVSLWPSIGNGALQCQSHYIIRGGRVDWLKNISSSETVRAIMNDRQDAEHAAASVELHEGWWRSVMGGLKKLLSRK